MPINIQTLNTLQRCKVILPSPTAYAQTCEIFFWPECLEHVPPSKQTDQELQKKREQIKALQRTCTEDKSIIMAYTRKVQYIEALGMLTVRIPDWERDGKDGHIRFLITVQSQRRRNSTHPDNTPSFINTMARHRYRDFVALNRQLRTQIQLPPKFVFRMTARQLTERAIALESWLKEVVRLFSVERIDELRDFLNIASLPAFTDEEDMLIQHRQTLWSHQATTHDNGLRGAGDAGLDEPGDAGTGAGPSARSPTRASAQY